MQEEKRKEEYGSGCQIVYGKRNQNIWNTRVYVQGTIDNQSNKEVTEHTRFDIASLTKTFTAILIHQAVEEKKFSFQTKVREIEPNFKNLQMISIEDLLCHRQEIWTDGYCGNAKSKKEFLTLLYTAYVKYNVPKYVDTHYIILSTILENVYQVPFWQLVDEKICKPLGLKNTSFHLKKTDEYASCDGETRNNEIIQVPEKMPHDTKARVACQNNFAVGHAGLFSTAKDIFEIIVDIISEHSVLLNKKSQAHFFSHDDYKEYIKKYDKDSLLAPYTYGGMRYKIEQREYDPVRVSCGSEAYLFSGYTGPIYFIDKTEMVVIVVMLNSVYHSKKTRKERLDYGIELINQIYQKIEHKEKNRHEN